MRTSILLINLILISHVSGFYELNRDPLGNNFGDRYSFDLFSSSKPNYPTFTSFDDPFNHNQNYHNFQLPPI